MKTKIGIYLAEDVARRFKVATRRLGLTKSDLVNEALRRFFDPPAPERDQSEEIFRLVKGLAKRIRRMQREVEVASRTSRRLCGAYGHRRHGRPAVEQSASRV
jgi:hypothetical protein